MTSHSRFCWLPAAAVAMLAALPAANAQGTPEQRDACMGDAFSFCLGDIPDVKRIEACLRSNRPRLTPACQAQFAPARRPALKPRRTPLRRADAARGA